MSHPSTPFDAGMPDVRWRFYSQREAAQIMGIGEDLMTQLVRLGAPTMGRKINLPWLFEWIKEHEEEVRDLKAK